MVGLSEVAFYSVACSIGMLVQIVTQAINNSFTPWVYQKIKTQNVQGIAVTVNALLLIIACVAFGLMLCSPELVLIFGSEEYASAVYVIPPVASSMFFVFLYNILAIPQFYFEKTHFMLFASLGTAILNIGLNCAFIKVFGFVAAGYTTLACYVLYSLGHSIISKVIVNRNLGGKSLYDYNTMYSMSAMVIVAGALCNFIFDYWYIRYSLIIVGILAATIKRKKLMNIMTGIRK